MAKNICVVLFGLSLLGIAKFLLTRNNVVILTKKIKTYNVGAWRMEC